MNLYQCKDDYEDSTFNIKNRIYEENYTYRCVPFVLTNSKGQIYMNVMDMDILKQACNFVIENFGIDNKNITWAYDEQDSIFYFKNKHDFLIFKLWLG